VHGAGGRGGGLCPVPRPARLCSGAAVPRGGGPAPWRCPGLRRRLRRHWRRGPQGRTAARSAAAGVPGVGERPGAVLTEEVGDERDGGRVHEGGATGGETLYFRQYGPDAARLGHFCAQFLQTATENGGGPEAQALEGAGAEARRAPRTGRATVRRGCRPARRQALTWGSTRLLGVVEAATRSRSGAWGSG
jgi:hypothetical protein